MSLILDDTLHGLGGEGQWLLYPGSEDLESITTFPVIIDKKQKQALNIMSFYSWKHDITAQVLNRFFGISLWKLAETESKHFEIWTQIHTFWLYMDWETSFPRLVQGWTQQ